MRKLIIITRPHELNGSLEYDDHWKDCFEDFTDLVEVINGMEMNGSDGDLIKSIKSDYLVKSEVEYGFLGHSDDFISKIAEAQFDQKIVFARRYSSQAGDNYHVDFDNIGEEGGWVTQILHGLRTANEDYIRLVIDQIWQDNKSQEIDSLTPFFRSQPNQNNEINPYDKILFVTSQNSQDQLVYEIKTSLNEEAKVLDELEGTVWKRSKSGKWRGEVNMQLSNIYVLSNEEIFEKILFDKRFSLTNFLKVFDLILIQDELEWGDGRKDAFDLMHNMINSLIRPVNVVVFGRKAHRSWVENTRNLKRQLVKTTRYWDIPLELPLHKSSTSLAKWEALKLALSKGGLVDKWLHDLKYKTSQADLNQFLNEITQFSDLVGLDVNFLSTRLTSLEDVGSRKEYIEKVLVNLRSDKVDPEQKINAKVLIVEDNPEQLRAIHARMMHYFTEVQKTSSGAEAIDRLDKEQFDLLICDLELLNDPKSDDSPYQEYWGIEVIEHARNNFKNIIVYALTAMPKAYVESIRKISSVFRDGVELLFKDANNDFLPSNYQWNVELQRIARKVKEHLSPDGPLLGKWGIDGQYRDYYQKLGDEKLQSMWAEVESRLVNFDYGMDVLEYDKGKTGNDVISARAMNQRAALLEKVILTRLIILENYKNEDAFYWEDFTTEVFGLSKSFDVKRLNIYLGFSYRSQRLYYTTSEKNQLFSKEQEILGRLESQRKSIIVPNNLRVHEVLLRIGDFTEYFDLESLDTPDDKEITYEESMEALNHLNSIEKKDDYLVDYLKDYLQEDNLNAMKSVLEIHLYFKIKAALNGNLLGILQS